MILRRWQAVNLVPADHPQDVYTVVLEVVKKKACKVGKFLMDMVDAFLEINQSFRLRSLRMLVCW